MKTSRFTFGKPGVVNDPLWSVNDAVWNLLLLRGRVSKLRKGDYILLAPTEYPTVFGGVFWGDIN